MMSKKLATGRAGKGALMKVAREIAKSGSCIGFKQVCDVMERDDRGGLSLKLWASASDRDEIERLCDEARKPMRERR